MRLIPAPLRRLARARDGFTMIVTLGAMMVGLLLTVAAFAAANSDIGLTNNDSGQKSAYYAAQAGVANYLYHLSKDNIYWTYCTGVPSPNAVNLAGSTTNRIQVPGSASQSYAIELMPANGTAQCATSDPTGTMIQTSGPGAGTFRIRSTGYSGNVKRTIVATFRRKSFLDYVWFTNYETLDPSTYVDENGNVLTGANLTTAVNQCTQYWRNNRVSAPYYSYQQNNRTVNDYCPIINFIDVDNLHGPMHTNDQYSVCNAPTFGRTTADNIEASATTLHTASESDPNGGNSGCSQGGDQTVMNGNPLTSAPTLSPPPSNNTLLAITQSAFHFTGTVRITLSGSTMTVTDYNGNAIYSGPEPSNGVVYVSNGTCSARYTPFGTTYGGNLGCGTAFVHGNYSLPLTIATENDIVVDGGLSYPNTPGDAMLGLIANGFVRLYHPCTGGSNGSGSLTDPTIDAVILSLNHSWIVDNYNCGSALGALTVNGTIAQNFRGPVGTGGGTPQTGYAKSYFYDDRLRYEEPPHFIDPVQAQWYIQRENECAPGTGWPC